MTAHPWSAVDWQAVVAVAVRTTSDGPFAEDVFWQLRVGDGVLEIPGSQVDSAAIGELSARLPGLDHGKIVRAMSCTRERVFRVWHRDEPAPPVTGELAARLARLFARLGGDSGAAPAVAERVVASWSDPTRSYHGLEHLADCLRELDRLGDRVGAGADVVELALWYHDLVYVPLARDNEEQSARALVRDAGALAIASALANEAAELVRATAHATTVAESSANVDLILDIDLAILGRDVLRFLDYECGIEEEYAACPSHEFSVGRARLLAALLARDHIYRTAELRDRYEQQARSNISALLASPRYRS